MLALPLKIRIYLRDGIQLCAVLSQRTVAKLETLLVKLCTPPLYSVPTFLNSGIIFNYLYERDIDSQLLNYLGNEYDYNPRLFVRAIHDGYVIQQFARIRFSNVDLSKEEATKYGDTILLLVADLALKKITEMDANTRSFIQNEVLEFVDGAKKDGFSFTGGSFCDRDGKVVGTESLGDLSLSRTPDSHRVAISSITASQPTKPTQPTSPSGVHSSLQPTPGIQTTTSEPTHPHRQRFSSNRFWTILGTFVAVASIIATIATPEVRRWLQLDKSQRESTSPINSSGDSSGASQPSYRRNPEAPTSRADDHPFSSPKPKEGSLMPNLHPKAGWLGFANGNVVQDRDPELRRNCGAFTRVSVPENIGNKFTDLCGYIGKTCERVCDWQGITFPCDAVSRGGNRDGTRIALCF